MDGVGTNEIDEDLRPDDMFTMLGEPKTFLF